jgi:hypothetical protein
LRINNFFRSIKSSFFSFFSTTVTSSRGSPKSSKKLRQEADGAQNLPTDNEVIETEITDKNHPEENIVASLDKAVSSNTKTNLTEKTKKETSKKVSTFSLVTGYSSSSNESD